MLNKNRKKNLNKMEPIIEESLNQSYQKYQEENFKSSEISQELDNNDDNYYNRTYKSNNNSFTQSISSSFYDTIPEFFKNENNEKYLDLYLKMRRRNFTDGALNLQLDQSDIIENDDSNIDMYENKSLNLDNIKNITINDNKPEEISYYFEKTSKNGFYKLPKKAVKQYLQNEKLEIYKQKMVEKSQFKKGSIPLKSKEDDNLIVSGGRYNNKFNVDTKIIPVPHRSTEEEIFKEFDSNLKKIIQKIERKIVLFFIFSQGILAGISIINILLLIQFIDFTDFINVYSGSAREIFNFTHAFTFISLVGNSLKFLTAKKTYDISNPGFFQNETTKKLKTSMYISIIMLIILIFVFCLLIYLVGFIPLLNYSKYTKTKLVTSEIFDKIFYVYLIINFLAIFVFIFNIFTFNNSYEGDANHEGLNKDVDFNNLSELNELDSTRAATELDIDY